MIFFSNGLKDYMDINSVEKTNLNKNDLIIQDYKKDKAKDHEVREKIQIYGENILNNVIMELKKYI